MLNEGVKKMECQKCETVLKEETKFCSNCGDKIEFSHKKDINPVKNIKRNSNNLQSCG